MSRTPFRSHVKLSVLRELAHGERCGYGLLAAASPGGRVSAGYLYPLLKSLTRDGFATAKRDGRKTVYRITPKGRALLRSLETLQAESLRAMVRTIEPLAAKDEIRSYTRFREALARYKPRILDDFDRYERLHRAMFAVYDRGDRAARDRLRAILADAATRLERVAAAH